MQQLPGRKDIISRNSVYEQSALDTFYGKTQEEAMELLLENFAHYSEHLGWMSSAGFAYYGQAWEKMLDCYDFESADPEFTHEFSAYTRCIIVWRYGWWKMTRRNAAKFCGTCSPSVKNITMAMTVSVTGWTRKTNSGFPYEKPERTTQ